MTGPTSCRPCSHCPRHPYCILTRSSYPGQGRLAMIDRGRFVQRGSVLYRLGDPLQAVYVALDGAFKTVAISDEGEERIIGFHLPGEPIGLDAFGERRHRCDAVALTDAHICEVSFEMFTIQTSENPRQLVRTLRTIGYSMARDIDHADMLARKSPSERIALFLHLMSTRLSSAGDSGTQFSLPMTREEIGRFLGIATETVSRGFTRLQGKGLINVDRRRVIIRDAIGLRSAARPLACPPHCDSN